MFGAPVVTTVSKVTLGLFVAALLCSVVGFSTPYWCDQERFNYGLFRTCISGNCRYITENSQTPKFKATLALEVLGLIVGMTCLILALCVLCVEAALGKVVKIVAMVLTFITAFLIVLGVGLFANENNESGKTLVFGWSFIMEIIAAVVYVITGVILIVDVVIV